MPRKPLRPCKHPGCPNLTDKSYCKEHAKTERDLYNRQYRRTDINKVYGSQWRKIRERYVALHPLCEKCKEQGRLVPVDEVHHIVPTSRGGTHKFSNLMSLCKSCHNKIHIDMGDR